MAFIMNHSKQDIMKSLKLVFKRNHKHYFSVRIKKNMIVMYDKSK